MLRFCFGSVHMNNNKIIFKAYLHHSSVDVANILNYGDPLKMQNKSKAERSRPGLIDSVLKTNAAFLAYLSGTK